MQLEADLLDEVAYIVVPSNLLNLASLAWRRASRTSDSDSPSVGMVWDYTLRGRDECRGIAKDYGPSYGDSLRFL